MTGLREQITAELDRLEALAQAATPGPYRDGRDYGVLLADKPAPGASPTWNRELGVLDAWLVAESMQRVDREHAKAWDPEAALLIVALGRGILERHYRDLYRPHRPLCALCVSHNDTAVEWPCPEVKALATALRIEVP